MAAKFIPQEYVTMAARFIPQEYVRKLSDGDETVETAIFFENTPSEDGRASLGVFFGEGSPWNKSELLPTRDANEQRPGLCAVLRALQIIDKFVAHEWEAFITTGNALRRVIIKSDSSYLVQSMTKCDFGRVGVRQPIQNRVLIDELWRLITRLGVQQPIQNRDIIEEIQNQDLTEELWRLITRLDREKQIKVLFWQVFPEENMDAHELANAALMTVRAPIWDFRDPPTQQEVDEYASQRIWRWHACLDHIPLRKLKATLCSTNCIDVTREQIQAEINKGTTCSVCEHRRTL
ncbi:hypothetical protein GQX73_g9147 [Xylaria multiplex]|uniref:Uncharacterized protein n=1 Tax=Xylaria multiplex TaxID=323545 RepID=A0A7C8ILE5_9PEZI|nr:hypothetical protein GQX73_g9147 [Xylaria multiplex]